MRLTLALGLLTGLAVAACSEPTTSTQPTEPTLAVTSNDFDKNIEGGVTNDCTGEGAGGTVRVHILTTSTDDGAGGFHGNFHLIANGKVTFGTETRYLFNQTTTVAYNAKVGEEETIITTFTLIGQGGASNEVLQFRLHYTVTPSGAIPTDFEWDNLKCQ
jgi:hypothetical protein